MKPRGIALLFLFSMLALSAYGQREYWLAPRTDHKKGQGTRTNPYNVSDAERFDRFFAKLKPDTTVHLFPGLYLTNGVGAFTLPSGTKLLGSGRTKTIIRLVQYHEHSGGVSVLHSKTPYDHDVTIANLTVDCNYHKSWGKVTTRAVTLFGYNHIVSNVGCIHASGFGPECFAIGVVSHVWPANFLIENCRVSHYAGGWSTAIFFGTILPTPEPPAKEIGGIVRNNEVYLNASALAGDAQCAYGGGSMQNVIFKNNYSWRATGGFNIDSGTPLNLVMENNTFSECSGVGITVRAIQPQYYIRNLIIKNNTVSLLPIGVVTYGTSIGSDHSPKPDDGTCADVQIIGNTFYCAGPVPKDAIAYSIRVYDMTRLTIANNRIEKSMPAQLLQNFHDLVLSGNTDLSGNPFPSLQKIPKLTPSLKPVVPLPRTRE